MILTDYINASAQILADLSKQDFEYTFHIQSHLGYERENQEDSASVVTSNISVGEKTETLHIASLADGCGGTDSGEVASAIVATHIPAALLQSVTTTSPPLSLIESVYHDTHQNILNAGDHNPESQGMASTAATLIIIGDKAYIAWVGDSRIYRYRDGQCTLLTKDHSRVQLLIDEGIITETDSKLHPMRNVLSKAMGGAHEPTPDVIQIDMRAGDLFILTSDGFHEGLSYESLNEHCAKHLHAEITAETLQSLAEELETVSLEHYGSDNLTAILAYVQQKQGD